jgi:DNA-binding MarR family transcriptional regulator
MTASPRLDRFLTYRLHRVARLADRDAGAAYADACGLGVSEGRCLAAIGAFEPLSLVDLARAANQDKGHASRSAKALVARGLVAKEASPSDARGVVLRLTRAGRPVHARAMKMIGARNDAAFAALTAAERRTLADLLDRVGAALAGDEAGR